MNKTLQFRIQRTFFGRSYESLITPVVEREKLVPLLYGAQVQLELEAEEAGGKLSVRNLMETESHAIAVSHPDKDWVNRMEGRVRDTLVDLAKWIEPRGD